jgi:3-methyl-2-oxobutanoate hydroxymethyltransferase
MKKISINDLIIKKREGQKITVLTAYDYYMGKLVDEAGIDVILVGDSLGMVIQGNKDTLSVSLDDMIYHTKSVNMGVERALIVTDLPFMSYQISVEDAMRSAGRVMKESGAGAVKLEGGKRIISQVKSLVENGIPVMGHLGLTPQSINQFSGFKVQGKDKDKALELIEDALLLEEAGVFSIVLETVPMEVASLISERLHIPTIGIGAGQDCDGQVLVLQDLLGVDSDFKPKFVRRYADLNSIIKKAVGNYINDVKDGKFPNKDESFNMDEILFMGLLRELNENGDN